MNFFDRGLARLGLTRKSLANPSPELFGLFGGGGVTAAGKLVNPQTAMSVPTVAACVRAISEAAGVLPCKLNVRLPEGGKEADTTHPAHALVHLDANPWTSAAKFREQLTIDALLHGHGVAYVVRGPDQKPRELIRLQPQTVTVKLSDTGEPSFTYSGATSTSTYTYSEVLYLPATSIDGICGVPPIRTGKEAIALAMVLEQHAAQLFGNAARPSSVLKFPGKVSSETAERIRAAWAAFNAGDKAGGTAIVEEGGSWEQITLDPVSSQFAELRAAQVAEICRIFRVPPTLVQDFGRATWANAEQANLQFLQHCLLPWLRTWESAYARVLLIADERGTHSIEFVVDDLLRADTATRTESYSKMIASRILNPNEVRALESLPPYAGGEVYANPATTSGAANDNTKTKAAIA